MLILHDLGLFKLDLIHFDVNPFFNVITLVLFLIKKTITVSWKAHV